MRYAPSCRGLSLAPSEGAGGEGHRKRHLRISVHPPQYGYGGRA
jgi:hypothetical protein